jgi:hypothetical protein
MKSAEDSEEEGSDDSRQDAQANNKSKSGGTAAGHKRSHASQDRSDDDSGEDGNDLQEFELDPEKRREVRKMRRVMANRRSARESRERRKTLLTDLQESVEGLTSENANLAKENLTLRRELASLMDQSEGSTSMNIIPNLQALLQGTQGFSGGGDLSSVPAAASSSFTGGAASQDHSEVYE